MNSEELTRRQRTIIPFLLTMPVEHACEKAKIRKPTVYKWLKQDAFKIRACEKVIEYAVKLNANEELERKIAALEEELPRLPCPNPEHNRLMLFLYDRSKEEDERSDRLIESIEQCEHCHPKMILRIGWKPDTSEEKCRAELRFRKLHRREGLHSCLLPVDWLSDKARYLLLLIQLHLKVCAACAHFPAVRNKIPDYATLHPGYAS